MRLHEFNSPTDQIVDNISKISFNDPSGWYVSGGCYEFAEALKIVFGEGAETWSADSADGNEIHAFTKFNGKFYDINGEHNSPEELLEAGNYYYEPPVTFNPGNGYADPKNVKLLVQELTQ